MLVLSRKLNQEIVIGDNIKVTILKVKGNTVRLGIEAPRNVRVVRGELPPKEEVFEFELEDSGLDVALNIQPTEENNEADDIAKLQRESAAMTGGYLDETLADITVVFDNSSDDTSTSRESSQPNLIPFSRAAATESKTRKLAPTARKRFANSQPSSVRFHGPLPESLKRNRLQEIVSQMTNNKS